MKFKSIILGTIIAGILASSCYAQGISVSLNGSIVKFANQEPVVVEGRTLIPLRGVFDNMGYDIAWNGNTKQVFLNKDNKSIVIAIGASYLSVNDEQVSLDVPAQIINGSTMIPLRAVADATGAQVLWDAQTKIATIIDDSNVSLEAEQARVSVSNLAEADYVNKFTAINAEYNVAAIEFFNYLNKFNSTGLTSESDLAEFRSVSEKIKSAAAKAKSSMEQLSVPGEYQELQKASVEYLQATADIAQLLIDLCDGKLSEEDFYEKYNSVATDAMIKEANYKAAFAKIKS